MNSKINQLIEFLKLNQSHIKPNQLKQFLVGLKLETEDLMPWADFNHPKHEGYGRKLVFANSNFEVMVMSWMPKDFSAVHNHGYTQWGAVQVFGPATHYVYKFEKSKIKLVEKAQFESKDVVLVSNDFIHQMGNKSNAPYLTLHIYGAENVSSEITADSFIYEIEKNRVVKTTGGAFFQLEESNVTVVEPLYCDDEWTLNEFIETILPKSQAFKSAKKTNIDNWIKTI
ncbi:MAG: cysteine dioxygenase [Putridiphycobacter sp.]